MQRVVLFGISLLVALNAFAHAGEVHTYMGTVTAVHADGSFTIKKTDGETLGVVTSGSTVYEYSDGKVADAAAIQPQKRVVVTISKDGRTASRVKIAAAGAKTTR